LVVSLGPQGNSAQVYTGLSGLTAKRISRETTNNPTSNREASEGQAV